MPRRREVRSDGFSIASMLCITGGGLPSPVAIPTEVVDGHTCAALTTSAQWVHQVCANRARHQAVSSAVQEFLKEVQGAMGPAYAGSSHGDGGAGTCWPSSDAASTRPAGSRGAEKLGLTDDDEDDLGEANVAEEADADGPASKRRKRAAKDWVSVAVRDVTLTVRPRPRGLGLLVSLRYPQEMQAVLVELRASIESGSGESSSPQKDLRLRHDDPRDSRGALLWNSARSTWQVRYSTADGVKQSTADGLSVPRYDLDGVVLTSARWQEIRGRKKNGSAVMESAGQV